MLTHLRNGLTVLVEENRAAPVVAIQVWVRVGSADERLDELGIAHLHEHMLFKGTQRRGPGEVLRAMDSKAVAGFLGGLGEEDFLRPAELHGLQLPVRLIWGESDRLLPAGTLDFFRQNLPAHRFIPLARAGHLPHLEAPLRLARAVLAR